MRAERRPGVDETRSRGAGAAGSLVVAGLGIRAAGQLTDEVKRAIAVADRVVYMNDPESTLDVERFNAVIRAVNPDIADVEAFDDGSASANTERAIKTRIEEIIRFVQLGQKVCIVTYGHPAVYNALIHRVVRRAREAKLAATVLPAISSVDCLCADMLVDQFAHSLQVTGALAFLALKREVDPSVSLALLQPSFLTAADRTAGQKTDGCLSGKSYLLSVQRFDFFEGFDTRHRGGRNREIGRAVDQARFHLVHPGHKRARYRQRPNEAVPAPTAGRMMGKNPYRSSGEPKSCRICDRLPA